MHLDQQLYDFEQRPMQPATRNCRRKIEELLAEDIVEIAEVALVAYPGKVCIMHISYVCWTMPFDHDPVKAAANIKKHGVSFADAEGVLFDPLALTIEDIAAVGEPRFVTMGMGSAGALLVVAYTYRNGEPRLISARRPSRKEREFYEA